MRCRWNQWGAAVTPSPVRAKLAPASHLLVVHLQPVADCHEQEALQALQRRHRPWVLTLKHLQVTQQGMMMTKHGTQLKELVSMMSTQYHPLILQTRAAHKCTAVQESCNTKSHTATNLLFKCMTTLSISTQLSGENATGVC